MSLGTVDRGLEHPDFKHAQPSDSSHPAAVGFNSPVRYLPCNSPLHQSGAAHSKYGDRETDQDLVGENHVSRIHKEASSFTPRNGNMFVLILSCLKAHKVRQ